MGKAFRLLFNLYPGEGRKASLFIILGLLWSIGSYGTFVLSEGMFLERVGAHALPKAYFCIAAGMCLLSSILIFCLNSFSIRHLLFSIIGLWILSSFSFYFLYTYTDVSATSAYWFIYKVIGWIIPISTYIVYWAFIDQYYDLQDGKRFFCLFNAVTFLGDSLGGGIISFLLEPLGVGGLTLLFIFFMLLSLPFILIITRTVDPLLEEHTENIDSTSSLSLISVLKTALKSKFTIYLLLFYFSMQMLAITTEYNYMDSFERAFASKGENALTEFNGMCGMWISLGNMLLGILFYSRLVKKVGVNNILLIAPTFFLVIFAVWFCKDALPIAIFGMIAREGVVYTFDDNNLNLLVSGVPSKIKNQVRISVESFIEPTGMLSSACLLLLLQDQGHLLGIILSLAALGVAIFLRAHYPKAIFSNLVASTIRFEKKASDWIKQFSKKEKRRTEFHLLDHLRQSDEKGQMLAYEYLLQVGNARVLPRLLNHIGKLTLPGKLQAIQLLSESKWAQEPTVIERLERWRRVFPHPAIKSAIHFHFAKYGLLSPERIAADLHNEHLGLRAAAILTFKTTSHAFQFPSYSSLASEKLRSLLDSKQEQEVCIGLNILGFERRPDNVEGLFPYLKHASLNVNRMAAKALALSAHPDQKAFVHPLIQSLPHLNDPEVRSHCLLALQKFSDPTAIRPLILSSVHFRAPERKQIEQVVLAIGASTAPVLLEIAKDGAIHDRCRLLAGKILGKIDLKKLQTHLHQIISVEIERAYFYFYHAHTIQKQIIEHDLSILEGALLTGYQSIIDFIIQILGVAGSIEECEILSLALRSKNRKTRAQAIESLEKTCDTKIFALLEPLIDERHPEEKLRHYLRSGRVAYNLNQLLDALCNSSSLGDQIVSVALKAHLKVPNWQQELSEKLKSKEEIFHHFANELLE